jgi:X-X-X-Leu-X-X-Gly heptad repeat protein
VKVSGYVPLVLGLQLNNPVAQLGPLMPGVAAAYETSVGAVVTSSATNATLSVADADSGSGRLVNGTNQLASALNVRATNAANPNTAFAALRGVTNPLVLLTYPNAIANDAVTIRLRQSISATEPLVIGEYRKTIVFALSTTTP